MRIMSACPLACAGVSALRHGCSTGDWRVEDGTATVAGEFVERRVQAWVAVAFVAEHLTGMDTALQLLPADQGASMGFLSDRVHLDSSLGLRLCRTASGSALVLPARPKTSAGLAANWKTGTAGTVQIHIGADPVHMSGSTAAVD
jgi:hypothetical protein